MVSLIGEDVGGRAEDLISLGSDQQLLDGIMDMCRNVRCLFLPCRLRELY
jgi:hypothetical protein